MPLKPVLCLKQKKKMPKKCFPQSKKVLSRPTVMEKKNAMIIAKVMNILKNAQILLLLPDL